MKNSSWSCCQVQGALQCHISQFYIMEPISKGTPVNSAPGSRGLDVVCDAGVTFAYLVAGWCSSHWSLGRLKKRKHIFIIYELTISFPIKSRGPGQVGASLTLPRSAWQPRLRTRTCLGEELGQRSRSWSMTKRTPEV